MKKAAQAAFSLECPDKSVVHNLWQSFDVEARRIDAGVRGAAGIAHHDSEFGEQGRKAMHRCAVIERVARHLGGADFDLLAGATGSHVVL